ncbi:response regulator [Desulfofustis limnaeus]|jgi:DNA-binding response OmpR family regulator|uniref:Two-component system response regulator n=1 Tax=Desulfofustis limnaeus TaxID=2740163 RepID=A0ABN6M238_9BACT|nr:response regulator [Desulfofustis limnaeus]MDX9895642.1 response regulator [Desulfofustis sp.]BDD86930.1 two-component system response regulator [Desulfofustis limnaeus]
MKKILIVDDDESIQLLYQEEFKDEGYQVAAALNGEDALELFRQSPPDLVILDIQMPGLNGIEVLRQMKMINPAVPVVISSAYNEYKQDLGAWASDEYVVKSSDISELKMTVRRLLG